MDIASILIHCDRDKIYKFMLDRQKINLWSFGIHWDVQEGDEIMKGISNFDQSISFLKITNNDKCAKLLKILNTKMDEYYKDDKVLTY